MAEWNSRVKAEMEHPYKLTYYPKDDTFMLTRRTFEGYGDEVDDIEKHSSYKYGAETLFDGRTEAHKERVRKQKIRIRSLNAAEIGFGLDELNHTPEGDKEAIRSIAAIIFEWTDKLF
jgi:hypothetical protein